MNDLFAGEVGFTLLVVRAEAFFCVFALEELLLKLAFHGEGRFQRDFPSGLNGPLDAADCLRRLIGRAEALGILEYPVPPFLSLLFRGPDVVDDSESLRFF